MTRALSPLTIRLAVPTDRTALVRLAQLDSRALPAAPNCCAITLGACGQLALARLSPGSSRVPRR